MDTQTTLIVVAALAVLALAALVFVFVLVNVRRKRTVHLKQRFGAEYDHTVTAQGGSRKAEARLEEREKRVEKLNIKPVPPELRDRFANSWRNVQAHFVDEPGAAVVLPSDRRDRGHGARVRESMPRPLRTSPS